MQTRLVRLVLERTVLASSMLPSVALVFTALMSVTGASYASFFLSILLHLAHRLIFKPVESNFKHHPHHHPHHHSSFVAFLHSMAVLLLPMLTHVCIHHHHILQFNRTCEAMASLCISALLLFTLTRYAHHRDHHHHHHVQHCILWFEPRLTARTIVLSLLVCPSIILLLLTPHNYSSWR